MAKSTPHGIRIDDDLYQLAKQRDLSLAEILNNELKRLLDPNLKLEEIKPPTMKEMQGRLDTCFNRHGAVYETMIAHAKSMGLNDEILVKYCLDKDYTIVSSNIALRSRPLSST